MRILQAGLLVALVLAVTSAVAADDVVPPDAPSRIEVIPIQTLTITDEQFLKGASNGKPVTIAGVLRLAKGTGRLPVVILVQGSGGFNSNSDVWDRQFDAMGISTFAMDSFAGRGITSTVADQSQLGRLNMVLDIYRSIAVLASNPRVDPNRIAVMGFSRGGGAALYASVKRFQKIWSTSESEAAAYIALYPTCNTIYIDDERVSEHPIRMFHGIPDDYVEITPCRNYYQRLKAKAKDIEMTEFPDTWHAYDYVGYPMVPTVVPPAQTTHCALFEDPVGRIINTATDQPFSYNDACVGRGPHVAYSPAATHATEERVKILLKNVFRVD